MACAKFLVMVAIVAFVYPSMTLATEYIVGDSSGWTTKFDYQAWAKDKMFYVGDKLVFKYTEGVHDVYKVNATAFNDCVKPPPSQALTSGRDVITLATAGKKWYICGKGNHCAEQGMKLAITVHDGAAPAPSPDKNSAPAAALTSGFQIFGAAVVAMAAVIVA